MISRTVKGFRFPANGPPEEWVRVAGQAASIESIGGDDKPLRKPFREERGALFGSLLGSIFVLSLVCGWPAASVGEGTAKTGDPEVGRSLFSGSTRFRNGGAPCLACHTVSGLPGAGATLGPDLTQVYGDYGEEEIAAALAELSFPSMQPIYETRPLTADEQSDVKAYLREAAEGEPPGGKGMFLVIGLGGGAFLIGLAHVVWRNRLREVRRPLLGRAADPKGGGA